MQAGVMVAGGTFFGLLVFALIGGPMVLSDWSRARRAQVIERQIALTDAIDARLGVMVAPVVKRRLRGPWEIEIAAPLGAFAALGRIIGIVNDVFADVEGMRAGAYRIVLRAGQDSLADPGGRRRQPGRRWAGSPATAA